MAIAERKYKTVTKQVPAGVTLELTKTEAIVLSHNNGIHFDDHPLGQDAD